MHMHRHTFLVSIALFLCATCSNADVSLLPVVTISTHQVTLRDALEVLADPAGKLTIDQVAAPGTAFGKPPVTAKEITRHRVYWLRFQLGNPGVAPQAIFIDPGPWTDARLFTPTATGYSEQRSGLLLPDAQRSVHMAYLNVDIQTFFLEAQLPPAVISTF